MKFPQLLGLIVAVHAGLIGILFFQPGCQSSSQDAPPPRSSLPQTQQPVSGVRPAPTSQVQPMQAQPTPTRQQVDPAFNANLPTSSGASYGTNTASSGSSSSRLAPPTRPNNPAPTQSTAPAPSTPSRSTGSTAANEGRLTPLINPEVDRTPSSSSSTASSRPDSAPRTYVVKKGDSLSRIATQNGTTVAALRAANNLKGDVIFPDQELFIPEEGSTVSTVPSQTQARHANEPKKQLANGQEYTIQKGDSLSRIASRHGTTVAAIKRANNLTSDLIRAGDKLVIPAAGSTASAAPAAKPAPKPAAIPAPRPSAPAQTTTSSQPTRIQPESNQPLIIGGGTTTDSSSDADEDALSDLEFDDLPPVPVQSEEGN